jgi:hypothetical protein
MLYLDRFEKIITTALMFMMACVVVLATGELAWILIKDALTPPILLIEIGELLELFGFFLLVLIGIAIVPGHLHIKAPIYISGAPIVRVPLARAAGALAMSDAQASSPASETESWN